MTDELKKELEEIITWTKISGDKILQLYKVHRVIFNDSTNLCTKCPSVIRAAFMRVKNYYYQNINKNI